MAESAALPRVSDRSLLASLKKAVDLLARANEQDEDLSLLF